MSGRMATYRDFLGMTSPYFASSDANRAAFTGGHLYDNEPEAIDWDATRPTDAAIKQTRGFDGIYLEESETIPFRYRTADIRPHSVAPGPPRNVRPARQRGLLGRLRAVLTRRMVVRVLDAGLVVSR
jgi:hypothetical protein